jgi:transcriptional regulator with XRE-family HTH domain
MLARLREAREEAGLTQAEVAARIERPQSFVSKCESGERRIDPTELSMFAKLYRRSASSFLEEGAEPAMDTKRPDQELPPRPSLPHGA